ncbi:MAG TPA: transglycosylase SLT domain-containing protein [Burkholderiales bacterium]|nr:transglycosylase SLT domain-containing protein [Burkholderiales bacterium]
MLAIEKMTRAFSVARGTLALIGLAVVLAAVLPLPREALIRHVAAAAVPEGGDPASVQAAGTILPAGAASMQEREQRAVAEFIARRYRVAETASSAFVSTAYRAGQEHAVDPLLILAVMAIESRYNPVAESSMGAKGLMQIIPRYHQEKLLEHGGEFAVLDPEVNILVGAQILREYMRRFGATETALQMYGGAMDEPTAQYAGKVLAEKARLKQFLAQALRRA